jgi:hypothetical protein
MRMAKVFWVFSKLILQDSPCVPPKIKIIRMEWSFFNLFNLSFTKPLVAEAINICTSMTTISKIFKILEVETLGLVSMKLGYFVLRELAFFTPLPLNSVLPPVFYSKIYLLKSKWLFRTDNRLQIYFEGSKMYKPWKFQPNQRIFRNTCFPISQNPTLSHFKKCQNHMKDRICGKIYLES